MGATDQSRGGTHPAAAGWRRSLPNQLTLIRVVLACLFIAMLAAWRYQSSPIEPLVQGRGRVDWWLLWAAVVFVTAAITDALDGWLARRWNVESAFGRVMDPFADKLLVLGAVVMMAGPGFVLRAGEGAAALNVAGASVEPWMAVVIIARELLVTSLRGVYEARGVSFAAGVSGKVKMVVQSAVIPLVLVLLATVDCWRVLSVEGVSPAAAIEPTAAGWVVVGAVWAMVVVTVWSGVPYVARAMRG